MSQRKCRSNSFQGQHVFHVYIGVMRGLSRGYMGTMENQMELFYFVIGYIFGVRV